MNEFDWNKVFVEPYGYYDKPAISFASYGGKGNPRVVFRQFERTFRETYELSKTEGIEYGHIICWDPEERKVIVGERIKGIEKNIGLNILCPKGMEHLGRFHTHPFQKSPRLSKNDLGPVKAEACLWTMVVAEEGAAYYRATVRSRYEIGYIEWRLAIK